MLLRVWRCNKKLPSAPSSPLHYMKLPDCHTSNTQNCCRTAEPSQHYSQQPSVLTNFIYTCYQVTMLVAILSFCRKSSFMYKSRIWQITTVFLCAWRIYGPVNLHSQCYVIFLRNVNMNIIKLLSNWNIPINHFRTLHSHPPGPLPLPLSSDKISRT